MIRNIPVAGWCAALTLVCLEGCTGKQPPSQSGEEERVREVFAAFQKALKDKDADKVWSLLDEDSQADAERETKAVRDAHARADDEAKKRQEKELGMPGAELAELKGPGFLKTRRFLGKYDEVPDSKADTVEVKGDKAVVNFIEPDGDREKFALIRQGGKWKLSVPMPGGRQP